MSPFFGLLHHMAKIRQFFVDHSSVHLLPSPFRVLLDPSRRDRGRKGIGAKEWQDAGVKVVRLFAVPTRRLVRLHITKILLRELTKAQRPGFRKQQLSLFRLLQALTVADLGSRFGGGVQGAMR